MLSSRARNIWGNTALVVVSICACFLAFEGYLWADSRLGSLPGAAATPAPEPKLARASADRIQVPDNILRQAEARLRAKTLPPEWALREVKVPGAAEAYYWQGALHVLDENGFRRTTGFDAKDPATFRVVVLGDSLTFGQGIAESSTYTALLNSWLSKDYRVEFLNLGIPGNQSSEILSEAYAFVPLLHADLVIYGVCLNDFLPTHIGEYTGEERYPFPLPGRIKAFLIAHTRTVAFLSSKYDAALRALHLRRDFFDDILLGFGDYQKRFRQDVAELNGFVTGAGLPPVIAMVLDQVPDANGRGHVISRIAERALADAGAEVIPTDAYYRQYSGRPMYVSAWEGHPNEVANYIWATMIAGRLKKRADLEKYRLKNGSE